jgi:hypothetical protein
VREISKETAPFLSSLTSLLLQKNPNMPDFCFRVSTHLEKLLAVSQQRFSDVMSCMVIFCIYIMFNCYIITSCLKRIIYGSKMY